MKARFAFSAFCMLVAMTMATSAFAQGIFVVSSGPEPRGRANGHTELSGGISVTMSAGNFNPVVTPNAHSGTVMIDYGVPITNVVGSADVDDTINVSICGAQRLASPGADDANRVRISKDKTMLTVHVIAGTTCETNTSINVDNVRLSLAGSGLSSVDATVSTTGHIRGVGSVQVTVISAVVDELVDSGVTAKALEVTRHTGVPVGGASAQFHLVIEENTNDSFEDAEINLEFSGLPEDVTVTLDAWVATLEEYEDMKVMTEEFTELEEDATDIAVNLDANMNDQVSIGAEGARTDTVESDDTKTTVFIASNMFNLDTDADIEGTGGTLDDGEIDVVIVRGSISGTADEDLLPLSLEIAVTADVGPIGVRDPEGTQITTIPRFATDKSEPVTVIEASPAQSTMQVAYVISEGTFDTGISVANMTSGRTAQSGAIHFSLFMDGNEVTHSTDMVGPQSSVTMLLSEVLAAAGHTGSFRGYLLIEADFNKADAGVFISDFSGFTAGATVRPVP